MFLGSSTIDQFSTHGDRYPTAAEDETASQPDWLTAVY
jgi:hypothetical protein